MTIIFYNCKFKCVSLGVQTCSTSVKTWTYFLKKEKTSIFHFKHLNLKIYETKWLVKMDFFAEAHRITEGERPVQLLQPFPSSDQRARWLWQMTCTQWCSNSFTSSPERLFCDHITPTHIGLHHQPPSREVLFFSQVHRKKKKTSPVETQKAKNTEWVRLLLLASLQKLNPPDDNSWGL